MGSNLRGVIAAIATAVDENGEPDCVRSTALARFLLSNGCDGLNVLGTTGEATSFSVEQRKLMMTAYRDAALPLERLMVGTGAASVADAVTLTRHAAEIGFAGALVLPPFYYKGVSDDGLAAYIEMIITATAAYFKLTVDDLYGSSRSQSVATARQIAMYLCRERTSLSLPKIGQLFGNRDHTTVMYAYKKISDLMKERRSIYNQVTEITTQLGRR